MSIENVKSVKGSFDLDSATRVFVWQGHSKSHHSAQPLPTILASRASGNRNVDAVAGCTQPEKESSAPAVNGYNHQELSQIPEAAASYRRPRKRVSWDCGSDNGEGRATDSPSTPPPEQKNVENIKRATRRTSRGAPRGNAPKPSAFLAQNPRASVPPPNASASRRPEIVKCQEKDYEGIPFKHFALHGDGPLPAVPGDVKAEGNDHIFAYNYQDSPHHAVWVMVEGVWIKAKAGKSAMTLKDNLGQIPVLRTFTSTTNTGLLANWVKQASWKRYGKPGAEKEL